MVGGFEGRVFSQLGSKFSTEEALTLLVEPMNHPLGEGSRLVVTLVKGGAKGEVPLKGPLKAFPKAFERPSKAFARPLKGL